MNPDGTPDATDTSTAPPPPSGGMPFGLDPQTIQALNQRAQQMLQSQVQSPWQQAFGRWASSPVTGALMGAASGFGQAAMPTPYRMPFGAVLGMGMQGMQTGMQNAYRSQQEQAQAQQSQMQTALQTAQLPSALAQTGMQLQMYQHPELLLQGLTPGGGGVGVTPPTMPQAPQAQQPSRPAILAPFVGANLPQGVTPDEDQMVRTVYGEARGEPLAGQQAVASVIRNRMKSSGQGAQDVIFSPNQFEPWNNPATRAQLESLDPNSQAYQDILTKAVRPIVSGTAQDPTGGATYFYSPSAQEKLGRSAPAFAQGNQTTIGNHQFYYGPYGGSTAATRNDTSTPLYLGDSLTSKGGIGGQTGQGKVGANPDAVLAQIGNTNVTGRDVVLSSGVTNSPADVAKVEAQLQALQKNGAKSVTLVGAAPQFGLDGQLQAIAQRNGARFVPLDPNQISEDKIHPTSAGYLALTNQTRPQGTQYAGPGVPSAPPGTPPAQPGAAAPGGGAPGAMRVPQNPGEAMQMAQQLNARAGAIEQRLKLFPMLPQIAASRGITLEDPTALRQQAQELMKFALAPGQAALTAGATAPIEVAKAGAIAQAQLPAEMAKIGFQAKPDGSYSYIPGMKADPAYLATVKGGETAAEAMFQNVTLRPGATARVGGQWTTAPMEATATDSQGREVRGSVTMPQPGSNAAPVFTPMKDASGNPVLAKQAPETTSYGTERGKSLAEARDAVDKDATTAIQQNYLFDNMRTASQSWTMDRFADWKADAKNYVLALAHGLGTPDDHMPDLTRSLGDYQTFVKDAGNIVRTTVHDTSSRAAAQEYNMIADTLPHPTMSQRAFGQIADQMQALNDYKIARQQYAQSMEGKGDWKATDAEWNKNISPTTFLLARLYQTPEGQAEIKQMIGNLNAKGAVGQATRQHMLEQYKWARDSGLISVAPPNG